VLEKLGLSESAAHIALALNLGVAIQAHSDGIIDLI
jgi:hypothetical protein